MVDFTTIARLVGLKRNQLARSDLAAGNVYINGSVVSFDNLDSSKTYLLLYITGCSIGKVFDDGTGRLAVSFIWDGGTSPHDTTATSSATVRSAGTGADEAKLTFQVPLCFTGHSKIEVKLRVAAATTTMRFGDSGDSVLALLYEVLASFPTNV